MADSESRSKIRIVKIIDILKEETDKFHPISTVELAERLEDYGIKSNRKTLYDDIKVISENYLEIKTIKKSQNLYYVEDRTFDPSEILIIASAINAAGFISESQSKDLVDRLYTLTSKGYSSMLKSSINLKNPRKHSNKQVFLNIESVINAIRNKKKIIFKYFHYNIEKKKEYNEFIASPVDLIYANDFFYCITYNINKNAYFPLRIDKMIDVDILSEEIDKSTYNSKNYINEKFGSKVFQMFTGNDKYVTLKVHKKVIDPLLDRFGESIILEPIDDTYVNVTAEICVSRTFFSWVLSFDRKVEIIGPDDVRNEMKEFIKANLELYNEV